MAFLLPLSLADEARAHGDLLSSSPASGDTVEIAPRELRLTFTEPVELAVTRLELIGPEGSVALGSLRLGSESAAILVAPIAGELVAGTHTVRWQVIGADGHPVRGEFSFAVSIRAAEAASSLVGPPAPGHTAPPEEHHTTLAAPAAFDAESPAYVAVRWLTFASLLGILGVVGFRLVVLPLASLRAGLDSSLSTDLNSRTAALGIWLTAGFGIATILRLYAQSAALHGADGAWNPTFLSTMITRTLWGWGWLLQVLGLLLVLFGFAFARRAAMAAASLRFARPMKALRAKSVVAANADSRWNGGSEDAADEAVGGVHAEQFRSLGKLGWAVAAIGALCLSITPALSGHAAAVEGYSRLPLLADTLHIVGAGGWLGSLAVLVAVGVPAALRLGGRRGGAAVASLVNAFSPAALFFAGMVFFTGAFSAWIHLGSIAALWDSGYGRTLLLKLALLSAVFGTGAYNWLRVRPALGEPSAAGRLRRSATVELIIGLAVIAATAVLVATPPPPERSAPSEPVGDAVATDHVPH